MMPLFMIGTLLGIGGAVYYLQKDSYIEKKTGIDKTDATIILVATLGAAYIYKKL